MKHTRVMAEFDKYFHNLEIAGMLSEEGDTKSKYFLEQVKRIYPKFYDVVLEMMEMNYNFDN